MLREVLAQRGLLAAFVRRDLSTRYRGSTLGWLWSLLEPLAMLALFGLVFGVLLKVQPPPLGDGSTGSYPAYLFTGLVMWNLITGLINASMTQLLISGELRRKVAFPAWAPVLAGSVVELIQVAMEVLLLTVFLALLGNVGWTWLLAIPILLAGACFGQGLGLALAVLNARFGDVMYTTTVTLRLVYFLTPVLYPLSLVESQVGALAAVVKANPFTWYVSALHDVLYSLVLPSPLTLVGIAVLGYGTLWAGFAFFVRQSQDVGELL